MVKIDESDLIFKILFIKQNVVQVVELGKDYPYAIVEIERIKPIFLTEEIFLKLGFWKNNDFASLLKAEYEFGKYAVTIDNGKISFWIGSSNEIILKYVHQLQNLYFALTGEELNVNNLLK